jgi:hypothetical protein
MGLPLARGATQRTLLRQRRALLAFGVLLGLTLVAGFALLLPAGKPGVVGAALGAVCVPYFLIPAERICGRNVYYVNPDGTTVNAGKTKDLHPMPKAPPVKDPR